MAGKGRLSDGRASPLPWVIVAALAVIYLAGWLLGLGTARPERMPVAEPFLFALTLLSQLVWPVLVSCFIFLSAAAGGALLLELLLLEPPRPGAALLCAAAIGLAAPAYAMFVLGSVGVLGGGVFWALGFAMLAAGAGSLWRLAVATVRQARQWAESWGAFEWTLVAAAAALLVVGLLCTSTPVLDYDALEYHLGGPRDHLAAGRVGFLPHNIYANFPAHVETLTLLGIVLGGSKSAGMAVAIVNQLLFGVLAASAVAAIGGRFVRRGAALPAAVFFLSCPLFVMALVGALIDLARCLYTAVALLVVLEWTYGDEVPARGAWLAIGGLCCGLAVAVKYTELIMLCVPLGAAVLAVSLRRYSSWPRRLAGPALLAGCAVLAVIPWLARNFVATGNPVFPLLYGIFGARGWSPEQAAKFAAAHSTPPVWPPGPVLTDVWRFLTGYVSEMSQGFTGPLAVLFVPLLLVLLWPQWRRGRDFAAPRAGPLLFLAGYWAAATLLWAVSTHRIARFLSPTLVPLSVLSAAGFCLGAQWRPPRLLCRSAAVLLLAFSLYYQAAVANYAGGVSATLGSGGLAQIARLRGPERLQPFAEAVEWVNDRVNVPPGSLVMLVGEARVFYFDPPLLYSAVFNDHPIEPFLRLALTDPARAAGELRASGATHVLVNWAEVARLRNYRYTYQGRQRPGYLPDLDLESRQPLLGLLRAAGRRVWATGALRPGTPSVEPVPVIEIYDLRPGVSPSPTGP